MITTYYPVYDGYMESVLGFMGSLLPSSSILRLILYTLWSEYYIVKCKPSEIVMCTKNNCIKPQKCIGCESGLIGMPAYGIKVIYYYYL